MKKLNLLFVLILGVIISSCGDTAKTAETVEQQEVATTEAHSHEAGEEHSTEAVTTTNSGVLSPEEIAAKFKEIKAAEKKPSTVVIKQEKKIKADAPTILGIRNMGEIISDLAKNKNITLDMYRATGDRLDKELNVMFEKCTMKGPAHDKLHEVLLPMVGYIKTIKEKDIVACKTATKALVVQLRMFADIFAR